MGQRGSKLSHRAYAVHVGEIQLELAQLFTFVLCPPSFRHIDGCGDNLGQRAPGGKHMIAGSFDPFDCSIR